MSGKNRLAAQALLAIGSCAIAFWTVWIWYVDRLHDGSDEPLGLIALVVAILMLVVRRKQICLSSSGLMGSGAVIFFVSVFSEWLPPLVEASFALLAIAFASGTLRGQPGIWGVAFLSLPLVASLQFYLGYPFRLFASLMTEMLLAPMPFEVTREGTNLLLNGETPVGVDPACSGIRMLWVGLLFGMTLAAYKQLRWMPTLMVGFVCLFGVLIGNGVRVSFLFVKESGLVSLPEWTHEGIGLLVFLGFVLLLLMIIDKVSINLERPIKKGAPVGNRSVFCFCLLAVCLAVVNAVGWGGAHAKTNSYVDPEWPTHWEGYVLEPVPMTNGEIEFSKNFPGRMATFQAGFQTVILRWVTRPTRRLHSSADCLRSLGYRIEVEKPGRFIATDTKQGIQYEVIERIYNDNQQWNEISAWFWAAGLKQTQGPWWATTVIRPL